ncbi:Mov34/MPN/PAD-1 family protein [Rhizobium sp. PAMB 3182]
MDKEQGLSGMRKTPPVITFLAGGGEERITFSANALEHMLAYRQLGPKDAEAGGQLFARLSAAQVDIEVATGPRREDSRSRFYFAPSRIAERREIRSLHRQGLHYVGDWHTHPERNPSPSSIDLKNIIEIFTQSRHALGGILMVIVGQDEPPDGLFVGIANGKQVSQLFVEPNFDG